MLSIKCWARSGWIWVLVFVVGVGWVVECYVAFCHFVSCRVGSCPLLACHVVLSLSWSVELEVELLELALAL